MAGSLRITVFCALILGIIQPTISFLANGKQKGPFLLNHRGASFEHRPIKMSVYADLEAWLADNGVKDLSVTVGDSKGKLGMGKGLIVTKAMKRGTAALNIPQSLCLSVSSALESQIGKYLKNFEGWTGEVGIIALHLLYEKSIGNDSKFGPFIAALPEQIEHPLFWNEETLELAQKSSTKGIKGFVEDVAEDFEDFKSQVIGRSPPGTFPAEFFNLESFKWAVACAASRSFFVDGELRLVPLLDFANHGDGVAFVEPEGGGMGIFGGKAVKALANQAYQPGSEFLVSYGPKSPAEYLEEHGFLPRLDTKKTSCMLAFGVRDADPYRDDKLDILELAGEEPEQCFDVFSVDNGEPDPAMMRFLRLVTLTSSDAFLLEAVFRDECWDFMALPISEVNEANVGKLVMDKIDEALGNFHGDREGDQALVKTDGQEWVAERVRGLARLRLAERAALEATRGWFERDAQALDLKEYYQERRLKSLGLDRPLDDAELMSSGAARDMDW
uniref:SET domain-containing protein n=1 Tax=Heterosigma akashiwo TaxID=2829 RepID=A0A6S9FGC7_HETAK|mmetsp:Transcript_2926/g.4586  ORF Transcript_2926/g.4586 Transcript_2926/m.4586 type:complete len:502 (-) Transcript_2926:238-1743(-)